MQPLSYKNDHDADRRLNPAEDLSNREHEAADSYNQNTDGLDDHPESADIAGGDGLDYNNSSNIDGARNAESVPSGPWANKVQGIKTKVKSAANKTIGQFVKKVAPGTALAGGAAGLGILGFTMSLPLMLVQFVEIISDRFDSMNPAISHANHMVLIKKFSDAPVRCKAGFFCKMETLSTTEIKQFEQQGITFEGEDLGERGFKPRRTIIKEGDKTTTLSNRQLRGILLNEPSHKASIAFQQTYNPRLHFFGDTRFYKMAKHFKLDKLKPFTEEDLRSRQTFRAAINRIRFQSPGSNPSPQAGSSENACPEGSDCTEEQRTAANEDADRANRDAEGMAAEVQEAKESGVKKALNSKRSRVSFGVLSGLQLACSTLSMANIISDGAKVVRATQTMALASSVVKIASIIKSGDATPEEVNMVANEMNRTVEEEVVDENGNSQLVTSKAATDSFGYRNAAYGDKGITMSAASFATVALLPKAVQTLVDGATRAAGGKDGARDKCNFINSPGVQILSGAASLAASFTIVGGALLIASTVAQWTITPIAMDMLTSYAIDTLAGNVVDDTTYGERMGDAVTTGYQVFTGNIASAGGGVPLTPEQAVENDKQMRVIAAANQQFERDTRSPFDARSSYTALGSILAKMAPYSGKLSSIQGTLSAFSSLSAGSIRQLISPVSKAEMPPATVEDFTSTDSDYKDANIATTPQGVPVVALPDEVLALPVEETWDFMMGHRKEYQDEFGNWLVAADPHIDYQTGQPLSNKFKNFIQFCAANRTSPYATGSDLVSNDWSDSSKLTDGTRDCMVTDEDFATGLPNNINPGSPETDPDTKTSYTNRDDILTATERKHFLAWYNYLRIGENQSEGFKPASEYTDDTVVPETNTVATTNPNLNTSAPANTKPRGSGWDLATGQDYSNISCFDNSSGTVTTHPIMKTTFRYCNVGSITGVNSMISANINQLLIDAKNSGLNLSGSGYRSYAVQQALRIQHGCANPSRPAESCRPPTARPGQSMHERGLAIDFSKCGSRSTACYQWLNKNAAKYGLINLPSEPWHWSVSGH